MSTVSDYTNFNSAAQRMKDSMESERSASNENHEKELEKVKKDSEEQIQGAKKEYNERLQAAKKNAQDEVKRLKEDLYGNSGKKVSNELQDLQSEKRQLSQYKENIDREAGRKADKAMQSADDRIYRSSQDEGKKVEDALAAQKKSHMQEVGGLQDELAIYRNEGRDVDTVVANAKQKALESGERENINERNRIIDQYERTIARMKDKDAEMEDHYARRLTDQGFEINAKAREEIKNQKAEFGGVLRDRNLRERTLETTFTNELKNEKYRNERASDHLITKTSEDQTAFAASKDEAYRNYLGKKADEFNYEVGTRDAKITELQTTEDPFKVSPFLVDKIHKTEEKRFVAEMNEADRVQQLNLMAEKERDHAERKGMRDDYQGKYVQFTRENQKQMDLQQKNFSSTYQDFQNLHDSQLSGLKEHSKINNERMYQKHAEDLTVAAKRTQDALDEQRDSLMHSKSVALEDADQIKRNQDRDWFLKTNDLRRNLEKQLTEERDNHERVTNELRLENDKKLRDMDRTSKRTLEDRVRAYEYQIKQQEQTFKEKERFLTEHYEEELDRMKRTNAHLIQKKS